MVKFPNAKINLGLRVTKKRDDGYHELQSVFYPVSFRDSLEILPNTDSDEIIFTQTGLPVPGITTENLCLRAYKLIKEICPTLPPINIHLHKAIPMGAGLGGGSSDAAFTLQLLNEYFSLHISENTLYKLALALGSDCPFFLLNKPCLSTGRGEKLMPIEINLSNYQIVIICNKIHISTAWAFSQIHPKTPNNSLSKIINLKIEQWQGNLINDFEEPVFKAYPLLAQIKQACISQGAAYAAMTGSGSSIYGIFNAKQRLILPEGCFYKWI